MKIIDWLTEPVSLTRVAGAVFLTICVGVAIGAMVGIWASSV